MSHDFDQLLSYVLLTENWGFKMVVHKLKMTSLEKFLQVYWCWSFTGNKNKILKKESAQRIHVSSGKKKKKRETTGFALEPYRTHIKYCFLLDCTHMHTQAAVAWTQLSTHKQAHMCTHTHKHTHPSDCAFDWLPAPAGIMGALSPCFPPVAQKQAFASSCHATLFFINLYSALLHCQQDTQSTTHSRLLTTTLATASFCLRAFSMFHTGSHFWAGERTLTGETYDYEFLRLIFVHHFIFNELSEWWFNRNQPVRELGGREKKRWGDGKGREAGSRSLW